MKLIVLLIAVAAATTFYEESFGDGWEKRWVKGTSKGDEAGDLVSTDGGVKTSTDARFYQYSATFPTFSNDGKDLVFQFSVAHPQTLDCGGGYFKLLPSGFDQDKFNGDTPYPVM